MQEADSPLLIRLEPPAWMAQVADPSRSYADDDARIALAIALAQRNVEERSGGPFGAALFDQDGTLIAAGVNRVLSMNCSLAHAETMALGAAQQCVQRARLNADGNRYTLAASAQPCCQCYGALVWAGIDELLVGARSEDVEALTEFDEGPLPADWIGELARRGIAVKRDLRREQARAVLAGYAQRGGARY
ncbi:MAG: nucleoside deaminase [Proteobacteria bacterium]|nr:nucleoside deaminase [Pseudomonadota bacterium]